MEVINALYLSELFPQTLRGLLITFYPARIFRSLLSDSFFINLPRQLYSFDHYYPTHFWINLATSSIFDNFLSSSIFETPSVIWLIFDQFTHQYSDCCWSRDYPTHLLIQFVRGRGGHRGRWLFLRHFLHQLYLFDHYYPTHFWSLFPSWFLWGGTSVFRLISLITIYDHKFGQLMTGRTHELTVTSEANEWLWPLSLVVRNLLKI